jgi:hypothetical protein
MVELIGNLPKEKMQVFSGYTAKRIEPVLGITPEPFDPVEVVPSLRVTLLLADDHMVALEAQRTVGVPVVGVEQTARLGVRVHQGDEVLFRPGRDRENPDLPVALQDPQDDDLACRSPTALPRLDPAKHGLVVLDHSVERLSEVFLIRAARSHQTIEPLDRPNAGRPSEPLPVYRHAQNEQLQQATLRRPGQATRVPCGRPSVPTSTFFELVPAVG